jgi:hypothetical protein
MTEAQWFNEPDPIPLLLFLHSCRDKRRFWIFAAACCRRFPELLETEAGRRLVDAAEAYADGCLTYSAVACAASALRRLSRSDTECSLIYMHGGLASAFGGPHAWAAAWKADDYARRLVRRTDRDEWEENRARADLVRDIFPSPLLPKPALDPEWLSEHDDTVGSIARWIYEDHQFEHMPVLHDALVPAGCDNAEVLCHARNPQGHTRGCWLLDLLLKKERATP